MMNSEGALGFVATLFVIASIGSIFFSVYTIQDYKQEAFDRGFMVQCVGKASYHWECENE